MMMTERGRIRLPVHLGVVLATLMLLAACSDSGDLSTSEWLSRAAIATEEERYREAIIELRNAVASDPYSAEARYRLGNAALTLGDAETAEKELGRAQELGFDPQSSITRIAEALLLLGRIDEALDELARAPLQTAQVHALRGLAFEASGEGDRALEAYQVALAVDPQEQRALLGMGRSALAKMDGEHAGQFYETAVAAHGDSPTVRLEYGRYLYAQGRAGDAATQYKMALAQPLVEEHLPFQWELGLSLAEAQLALGQREEADQTIAALGELQPDHMLVKYLRARSAFERKDLAIANDLVERVIVEAPSFVPGQILQATLHLARSEYSQATVLLERLAMLRPDDAQVRKLLAAALSGGETRTTQDGKPIELSEQDVLSMLGAANAQKGDYLAAVSLWERVLAENPGDESTRLELTSAYLLSKRLDAAQSQLDAAEWRDRANAEQAAVLDTLIALLRGDVSAARSAAAAAAERFPASAALVSLQGLIEIRQDTASASRYFQRALELDPSHTTAVLNLSNIALASGDEGRATALLRSFVDDYPRDPRALDALARLQLRADDLKGARDSLERARLADPNAVAPRLQLAELLTRTDNHERAVMVAREVVAARPTLAGSHNALGLALIGQGKLNEGMDSLRTAVRMDETALEPLRNLARAEYASRNLTQAQQTIDQLLRAQPNDTVALDLATRVAIDQGRADEAQARLARLVEADPDGTAMLKLVLTGDIAMIRGQHDEALHAYEAVFAEQQTTTMVMRLFRARQRRGDEQPQQVLRDWLEQNPDDQTVRLAAAMHAQSTGELVTATLDYEHMLRLDRADPVVWNNLAWAYSDLGDFRALDASRRAFDLAKDSPNIQDTYGWMLILDDQVDNGIAVLRDAWAAAPSAGEIGYHLAAGLVRAGQTEEARSVLAQALADGGQFATRGEAEQLLAEL